MRTLKIKFLGLAILCLQVTFAQESFTLKGDELFGDMKARQIGPALMSGRIADLELHPTNNKIIYVGSAGGGVWKSTNGGASYFSIFDKYIQSIGCVSIDPSDPDNTIWVGTGEVWTRNSVSIGDGIYKSTDGGQNWTKMGLEKSDRISSIIIDPKNSNTIWVGVLGALWGDNEERGIYKSIDGGTTWDKVFYIDPKTGCSDIVMDPKNSSIMYASFWEFRRTAWSFSSGGNNSALYKSTDGGKSWNKIHNGFPKGKLGRIAIAVAPSNTNILYSVLETENKKDNGLYRSDDAGKSWKHLNNDFGLVVRPFYFSRIVVDPKNPDIVIKGGFYGSISRDGGKTFKNLGNMHADIHDIAFDIHDSSRLYCGTDGGVYRSWDGGTTMEIVSNLPVSQYYHISLDDKTPYNIYGGLQDNGSWYGPSKSPGGIESRDWNSIGGGDGFRVLKHPTKDIIYSEMQGAEAVWRYNMETKDIVTIQPLQEKGDPKLRFNWNAPMAVSKKQPDRFYFGSQFLYKSEDMGESWVKISPDLTTNDPMKTDQVKSGGLTIDNSGAENHCTIFTIAESPLNEKVIWVGTDDGNVQITQNGGKTWTNVVGNIKGLPKNTWCYHIEASVFGEGIAYAVFEGHTNNDYKPYAFKTTDFGKTWKSIITDEVDGFARNIQEDFKSESLLFLGTEKGLYISVNGGENWSQFTNEMPEVAVHFIDLHPTTNDLVLATHGRGVIILDDISILRSVTPEVLEKDIYFFDTKTAIIDEESSFGSTATELEFVGPNPSSDAQIAYYMKKRHIMGKMSLEIQDENGNLVKELDAGKKKGINIVNWNFLTKVPKIAVGLKRVNPGILIAPAGKYVAVLKKGNETYTHNFEIKNDPKSAVTEAERKQQREVAVKLFDMNQTLAYTMYQVEENITALQSLKEKQPKKSKEYDKILGAYENLKKKTIITTGDNYTETAEPLLREKLAELSNTVSFKFNAPSPSEMRNYEALKDQLNKTVQEFDKLQSQYLGIIQKDTEVNGIPFTILSFEDFIAK